MGVLPVGQGVLLVVILLVLLMGVLYLWVRVCCWL